MAMPSEFEHGGHGEGLIEGIARHEAGARALDDGEVSIHHTQAVFRLRQERRKPRTTTGYIGHAKGARSC